MNEADAKQIDRVINLAMKAGRLLLKSGAEIRRVEEVMVRIAGAYDIRIDQTCFSLTNGLFVSYSDANGNSYAKVYQEPIGTSRFNHLIDVNQFARDLVEKKPELSEAERRLHEIEEKKDSSILLKSIAAVIAGCSFAFMFRGNVIDGILAGIIGALTLFITTISAKKFSKIVSNMLGGLLMAGLTYVSLFLFPDHQISPTIIITGAMMPLVPGIAFANGVRDIGNTDYLSGVSRLMDALLVFISIAVGASLITWIFPRNNFLMLTGSGNPFMDSIWMQMIFAGLGAGAFAVIFQTPKKYIFTCAIVGLISWGLYYWISGTGNIALAALLSSMAVSLLARIFARLLRAPATIFIVPGIVPTVPGSALLFTFYGFLTGQVRMGAEKGLQALQILIGIVIGIALINAIPQKFFRKIIGRKNEK